jgi:hypothetical protein
VKITIFKILNVSTIFTVELKQYAFRIQQDLKLINNNFYKFIKKFYFVSDKRKQRVCIEKIRERIILFLISFCQHQTNIYKENNIILDQCVCKV